MEEVKQILVVDDYFQMLEFLRSVLEFSHHEYQVLAVPSAEEGVLELRRTAFDLVITDVRLPGMSGFDMVRKIKSFSPETPVIMITAYSTEQGRKEAEELGVKRYFKKPLDPDELLAAVHTILYGTEQPEADRAEKAAGPAAGPAEVDLSAEARRRLETLRSDTGARHVMLSDMSGQIIYDGGIGQELNLPVLAESIAESIRNSFRLAEQLDSPEPFTIQFQSGKSYDLYFANVRQDYCVSIFFNAQARRGRLGTIWVFAQRAINDLQDLLTFQEKETTAVEVQPEGPAVVEKEGPAPEAEAVKTAAVAEPDAPIVEAAVETAEPDEDAINLETTQEMEIPSLEDIRKFLGIESSGEQEEVDLDSFWDDAMEETPAGGVNSAGMSLEEARKQGLIPTEFDQLGRKADSD